MHIRYKKENIKNRNKKLKIFSHLFFFFLISNFLFLIFPADPLFASTFDKKQSTISIPAIYPRSTWSNSTYDKRSKKIWPAQFEDPKILIVHHTATSYKSSAAKQVKKIYKYHSYIRKWGDIGYNYVIGKDGTIFEGRYGGNGVIGGHSYSNGTNYNKGSIGIAVLGNYQTEEISDAALDSLGKLTGWLARNNSITINYDVKFFGKKFSSAVIGHRNVADTACPGKHIYDSLGSVRTAGANYENSYQDYAYRISGDDEKYEITGGKRYSGSEKGTVVEIAKTQLEAYPSGGEVAGGGSDESASDASYPSGTLVKSAAGSRGMIENGLLRPIASQAVLESGYSDSNFVAVTDEKWSGYSAGSAVGFRDGAFVKDESGNYLIIDGGRKRKLDPASADFGLVDSDSAHAAAAGDLSGYADGSAIASFDNFPAGTVITYDYKKYFWLNGDGTKKQISKNVFAATFSRSMAVKVSKKFSQKLKVRGKLSFQNGATVNYRGKYYFIENGLRRQFASKSLAASMGYRNIRKAKRTEMSGIGTGAEIE